MAGTTEGWVGLEFAEALDSEALKQKLMRDARIELWGRGILAVLWFGLAIAALLEHEQYEAFLVYCVWPLVGISGAAMFFMRRSQIAKTSIANEFERRFVLLNNKVTVTTKGDNESPVGEPEDYYWAYAKSVNVGTKGVEVTFGHRRKAKTILIPTDVFPGPDVMEAFKAFVKGEAARCGLSPKENWLRPPG